MNASWNTEELDSLLEDLTTESSSWITRESVIGLLLLVAGVWLSLSSSTGFGLPGVLLGGFFVGSWDGKRTYRKLMQRRIEDLLLDDGTGS